jgi:general secretion pathway protein L
VSLVVAQIVGLNLWAWQQRSAIETRRESLKTLVKASFPRVSDQDIQRDPAAVMQRETQSLRSFRRQARRFRLRDLAAGGRFGLAARAPGREPSLRTRQVEPRRNRLE